jgi:hypothetical protein
LALIALLSVALSFVLTLILGFEDIPETEPATAAAPAPAGKQAGRGHRMAGQAANTGYCATDKAAD